jgi:lysophospholipase L1-like esterase
VEPIENRLGPQRPEALEVETERDIRAAHRLLAASAIDLVLLRYAANAGPYLLTNRAIEATGRALGLPVVDSSVAIQRLPAERRSFLPGFHPNGAMYVEIARDLASVVQALASKR